MGKRIVLCCDGTWNKPDQNDDGVATPTNVSKLAAAVRTEDDHGVRQVALYHRGVGTNKRDRLVGGAFGVGLSRIVREAYRDLVAEYEPGDELFLFGFSRGAYTARSVAGLIRNAGMLRPEHAGLLDDAYDLYRSRRLAPRTLESRLFRASYSHPELRIRFMGVWDTVGALGLPWSGVPLVRAFNSRWSFHDTRLSSTVDAAYQALAIDEKRRPYAPAVWERSPEAADRQILEQVWFAGDHSDVGGGHRSSGLSDLPLRWIARRARDHGLALCEGVFEDLPDALLDPGCAPPSDAAVRVPFAPEVHATVHDAQKGFYRLWPALHRPIGLRARRESAKPAPKPPGRAESREMLASTALARHLADPAYRPAALERAMREGLDVAEV